MKKIASALALGIVMSSCSMPPYQPYAREVKRRPQEGGSLALRPEYRPEDRTKAQEIMSGNCGEGSVVKIKEEGEVAVSQRTVKSGRTQETSNNYEGFKLGGLNFVNSEPTNGTREESVSQTEQIKEWQILYDCVSAKPKK